MARMRGGNGSLFQTGSGINRKWRGRWRVYEKALNGKEVMHVKRRTIGLVTEMLEEDARIALSRIVAARYFTPKGQPVSLESEQLCANSVATLRKTSSRKETGTDVKL